ncbi:ATP-dependent Clp protease proteolytic subunit [Halomicronema sp. CCY15110]|uniref:ATP-dependent Clp protease proteolytic subunit n=1 Tax=Halomicronema sp. CCY15110 TaxID=2767773 RepID=UPI00194F434E|nr:ATP-dependent Clp protease proteolytic subunit [Halomicronema sp. CCY15110]
MSVDGILRVPYQVPGSQNWQWINIYTRLSQERIIFLNQPVSMGLANSVISALLYLDSEDQGKPINLYINSMGDPVTAGMADAFSGMAGVTATLAILDTMQHIKSEITTICMGQCFGVATVLLSAGTPGKRVSLPHSMITLAQPKVATQGQATDIQINAGEVIAKRQLMMEVLSRNTGQSLEKLTQDMDRTFYLTPQEAVEYGIIDRVLGDA